MKYFCFLLTFVFLFNSSFSFAQCDWAEGVKKSPDGSFSYSKGCHLQVGVSLEELDLRRKQVQELTKSVELKDLALNYSEQRTQLWMDSSLKMNDRLNQYESARSSAPWIYFGVGVVATVLSVWAAGQLRK
jgi:hypothetical protein